MSASFTPGPWKAEEGSIHHAGQIVITADHAGMTSNTPLARLAPFDDAVWPDARLIAAAPDLYEALKGIEDFAQEMVGDIAADAQAGDSYGIAQLERWSKVAAALSRVQP